MHYDEFRKELDELWGEIALLKSENAALTNNKLETKRKPHPFSRPVIQYNLNMKKINEFESLYEASKKTGIRQPNIWSCCNGNLKTTGGFIFRYKN